MPQRLHPFACLRDFPVVSSNSRDGIIYQISDEIVFKSPFAWTGATSALFQEHLESVESIRREKTIYNLLSLHQPPQIISMILSAPEGIFLRLANEGSLERRLAISKQHPIEWVEKLHWIKGIIEGDLALGDLDLVHGDLNLSNILLHDGQVKLCDLCATVRKNHKLIAPLLPRFSKPVSGDDSSLIANEQSEIFAIGTCIYALIMEHLPYPTLTEGEVATLFEMKQFPPTNSESFVHLGAIIRRCWAGSYSSIKELDTDVGNIYDRLGISRKIKYDSVEMERGILESLESQCEQFLEQARKQVR